MTRSDLINFNLKDLIDFNLMIWLLLSLHERFPQHRVRTRERCSAEDGLACDGVPVEITREGGAAHNQPAGDVG